MQEIFFVTGRNFLALQVINCHRKKFIVTERNLCHKNLSQEDIPKLPQFLAEIIGSHEVKFFIPPWQRLLMAFWLSLEQEEQEHKTIFGPKHFFGPKFFSDPNFFSDPKFYFGPTFFRPKIFLVPTFFSDPKIFLWPKILFRHKIFSKPIFFGPKFFSRQKNFLTQKNVWTHFFADPKQCLEGENKASEL